MARVLRRLHLLRVKDPVEEALRGWRWFDEPLRPKYPILLGVSEIAYRYCPTRRDVFLRRVHGIRGSPSEPMVKGRIVHEAFHRAARDLARLTLGEGMSVTDAVFTLMDEADAAAKKILDTVAASNGDPERLKLFAEKVYKLMVLEWSHWVQETGAPPWITEYEVDGSLLGLSRRLRIDALAPGLVVEVKYGRWSSDYPVAVAGYALALEANLEIPFDYGLVILVNGEGSRITLEPVYIGNEERRAFIQARDEVAELLAIGADPGRPSKCPEACPFRPICPVKP